MALITEGFSAENRSSEKNYCDKLEPQEMGATGVQGTGVQEQENSTPSPPSSCRSVTSSSGVVAPTPPVIASSSTPNKQKSDHFVSRMKLFFQGGASKAERPQSPGPPPQRRYLQNCCIETDAKKSVVSFFASVSKSCMLKSIPVEVSGFE